MNDCSCMYRVSPEKLCIMNYCNGVGGFILIPSRTRYNYKNMVLAQVVNKLQLQIEKTSHDLQIELAFS